MLRAPNVLIVDDHAAIREGLRRSLEAHGVHVAGDVGSGEMALVALAEMAPDIVLLDISLPDMDGIEVARRIRQESPGTRVVMLTMYADRATISAALAAGAAGYLLKDCTTAQIVDALEQVTNACDHPVGELALTLTTTRQPGGDHPLSARELEVLQLIAQGASTNEVAERLFISAKTAKNHLANIYEKLDACDRTQAVVHGLRLGIIRLR